MKIILILFMVLLSANTFAIASNELVTVRASYLFGIEEEGDLTTIYAASVFNSGKTLKVSLHSKTPEKTCVDWYWFNDYGEETDCDDCLDSNEDFCFCVVGHCDDNKTNKRVTKTKRAKSR